MMIAFIVNAAKIICFFFKNMYLSNVLPSYFGQSGLEAYSDLSRGTTNVPTGKLIALGESRIQLQNASSPCLGGWVLYLPKLLSLGLCGGE
jgi:hypothetical protein